ncbi:MAG: acylneuraminate cytidylyltransferase family protein [Oscillospiraceae bacterium]
MNILVTICARAGSKGVKSKNMRDFLEYPICFYTLSAYRLFLEREAHLYGQFDLAVNTDSQQLYDQIDSTGTPYIKVPRKEFLAGDTASKTDVMRDTLKEAQAQTGKTYDFVVDMDLTSPLRRVEDIKSIVDTFIANPDAEIALSVTESRRNPYFNQLIKKDDGFFKIAIDSNFVARQQAPEVFDANASLYAYSPEFLNETTKILSQAKLVCSIMPDTAVLDIDSERDFELMQMLAKYFYESDEAFGEIHRNIESFCPKNKKGLFSFLHK